MCEEPCKEPYDDELWLVLVLGCGQNRPSVVFVLIDKNYNKSQLLKVETSNPIPWHLKGVGLSYSPCSGVPTALVWVVAGSYIFWENQEVSILICFVTNTWEFITVLSFWPLLWVSGRIKGPPARTSTALQRDGGCLGQLPFAPIMLE